MLTLHCYKKLFRRVFCSLATLRNKEFFDKCFVPVIGLEIHAQLDCQTKLFSGSLSEENVSINSCVALFDIATPGTLPRLNRHSVNVFFYGLVVV